MSDKKQRYFKKVLGEKVYLSPVNPDDFEIYVNWLNDPKISIPLGSSVAPSTLLSEKNYLEEIVAKGAYDFAIVALSNDLLLGGCSITNVDNINRSAEIGIFIGDSSVHGEGYGGEAIKLLLSYAFKMLNLHSVSLEVSSFNEKAIYLYGKVGFQEVGKLRESVFVYGKYWDTVLFDILKKDFKYDFPIVDMEKVFALNKE